VVFSLQLYRLHFVCTYFSSPRWDNSIFKQFRNPNACVCVVGGGGVFFFGRDMKRYPPPPKRSRYSDWLRAGRRRCRSSSPAGVKNFAFSMLCRPALGPTKPPIQWVPGALSPGVERPGRQADHSPPASAEVKKM
jgi:hypothetical protein